MPAAALTRSAYSLYWVKWSLDLMASEMNQVAAKGLAKCGVT